jgi:hypothetical protein
MVCKHLSIKLCILVLSGSILSQLSMEASAVSVPDAENKITKTPPVIKPKEEIVQGPCVVVISSTPEAFDAYFKKLEKEEEEAKAKAIAKAKANGETLPSDNYDEEITVGDGMHYSSQAKKYLESLGLRSLNRIRIELYLRNHQEISFIKTKVLVYGILFIYLTD